MKDGEFYKYELNTSDSKIKYLDIIIKENPKMSAKEIDKINQLKSLYTTRKDFFKIKIYNPKSKLTDLRSLDDEIGYKPDVSEQTKFEYSSLGKVFTDGLDKSDRNEGLLKRLKNIEDKSNNQLLTMKNVSKPAIKGNVSDEYKAI